MTSSFFSIASIRLLSPGCVSQLKRLIRYAACGGSLGVRGSCFFFPGLSRGGLTSCRSAPQYSCRSLGPNPAVGEPRQELRAVRLKPPLTFHRRRRCRSDAGAEHYASKWIGSLPSRPPQRPPQLSQTRPSHASTGAGPATPNARRYPCMLCPGGATG